MGWLSHQEPIQDILQQMMACLSPANLLKLSSHIAMLARQCGGSILLGTACSGTDLIVHILHSLLNHFQKVFGMTLKLRHVFAIEIEPKKQDFLRAHWTPEALFSDLLEVVSSSVVHEELSGEMQAVVAPTFLAIGIECDSISGLNSQSQAGEGLVSSGSGRTGSTGQAALKLVGRLRPSFVIFENVKNLNTTKDAAGKKESDLIVLVRNMNAMGYHCVVNLLRSSKYGMPQSRDRYYILGFRI